MEIDSTGIFNLQRSRVQEFCFLLVKLRMVHDQ